jgi:hypothetical protein
MTEPTISSSPKEIPIISKTVDSIKTNDKADEDFRKYSEETSEQRVVSHYRDMRRFQTVHFYRRMEEKYSFENGTYRKLMTIDEAFKELEHYVVCYISHDQFAVVNLESLETHLCTMYLLPTGCFRSRFGSSQ